jgi:GNAT superfamily N-acetyltransferase
VILIVSSRSASPHLSQLREWMTNEWGKIDPFDGGYEDRIVPPPVLAIDGDELLGGLAFTNAPVQRTEKIGLWVNVLFVLPKYRGRGIGSKLVAEAEVEAKDVKADELFVYTDVPSLYEKLGWTILDDSGANTVLRKRIAAT